MDNLGCPHTRATSPTMPESLRKVLLGALIGALVVAFAWHVLASAPSVPRCFQVAVQGCYGRSATGRTGFARRWRFRRPSRRSRCRTRAHHATRSGDRSARQRARERVHRHQHEDFEPSSLPCVQRWRAREARQVLVRARRRAGARGRGRRRRRRSPRASSQYNRSRELFDTQALSKSQLRPARGHAQSERARVAAARARAGRHRDPRAVLRPRRTAARQRRHPRSAPAPSSPRSMTPA